MNTLKNINGVGAFHNLVLGFTLAEVLVTLGIIGVVSAMTLPTLVKNHQRKVYVTQLHKVYSEFQQAAETYVNERNAVDMSEAGLNNQAGMSNFIASHFKTVKNCTGTPSNCLATNYKNLNGAAVTAYADAAASCYSLASGSAICAKQRASNMSVRLGNIGAQGVQYITNPGMIGDLIVDSNGKSGPNILGRDLFVLGIFNDGSLKPQSRSKDELIKCRAGASCPDITDPEDITRCKSATTIEGESNASLCFDTLINDNWEMSY